MCFSIGPLLGKPVRRLGRCPPSPPSTPSREGFRGLRRLQSWGCELIQYAANICDLYNWRMKYKGESPSQSRLQGPDVCRQRHNAVLCCISFLLLPLQVTKPPSSKSWIKLNILPQADEGSCGRASEEHGVGDAEYGQR